MQQVCRRPQFPVQQTNQLLALRDLFGQLRSNFTNFFCIYLFRNVCQVESDCCEDLSLAVVQIARDASALFVLNLQQPARQRSQFL